MCPWKLLPQSRKGKVAAVSIGVVVLTLPMFYLILLAEQRYSAWQASKMLDDLEAIRIGDPAANFERAARGCKIEKTDASCICVVSAGAFRWATPWILISKLPYDWTFKLRELLDRAGLSYWRLSAYSTLQDGRIQSVSAGFYVDGRYEMLGASWAISEHVPPRYGLRIMSPDQQRTYLGWYHITSIPRSGEGFRVHATPTSTEMELRARRINRSCLFSSRGCDGLCELLPDVVPVLRERNSSWGGGTDTTPSKCQAMTTMQVH